jgi:hypothetical protein
MLALTRTPLLARSCWARCDAGVLGDLDERTQGLVYRAVSWKHRRHLGLCVRSSPRLSFFMDFPFLFG